MSQTPIVKNLPYIRRLASFWGPYWGVEPAHVAAIVTIESHGRPDVVNQSPRAQALGGAWGLMQITAVTARDVWRTAAPSLEKTAQNMQIGFIARNAAIYVIKAWTGEPTALVDPELNVCLGTSYLARLQRRIRSTEFRLVAAAYHQGPARVSRFLAQGKAIPDGLPPLGKQYVHNALAALSVWTPA